MAIITFADVVHQSISFDDSQPAGALVLELIDTRWMQRLRDISQTANTRLVFMFSEHSRFGHSLGAAFLAQTLMDKLSRAFRENIERHRLSVMAAALLHDLGHVAPGSHTAYKTWFPGKSDGHEALAGRILQEDDEIRGVLGRYGPQLVDDICSILSHSASVPPWTWELITGGGWNVDRGNWCVVDSILAGVSYGKYNIPALTESIMLTPDGHLALRENRIDAMVHFAVSRHAMYRQLYQHRVLLAADMLNRAVVQRARDLKGAVSFADRTMEVVLASSAIDEIPVSEIFRMRESWWRYHLYRWCDDSDPVLSDLARRLVNRKLFKTIRVQEDEEVNDVFEKAKRAVADAGYDPSYYLHQVHTFDTHGGDLKHSMRVLMDNGSLLELQEAEPLFRALADAGGELQKIWLAMPDEAKLLMGRKR